MATKKHSMQILQLRVALVIKIFNVVHSSGKVTVHINIIKREMGWL